MAQSKTQMESYLRELQEIQIWAFSHNVRTFEVAPRIYSFDDEGKTEEELIIEYGDTVERTICVTVFLRGDDSDGDYLSERIYSTMNMASINRAFAHIRDFIGMEED